MKKIVSFAMAVMLFTFTAFAYDSSPPASSDYGYSAFITMDTQQLGEITVQLPVTWLYNSLSWNGSDLRNITTSTITGYYGEDTTYDVVRWSGFSGPQYRTSGNNYSYYDLTVNDIVSTNVQLVDDWSEVGSDQDTINSTILILMLGVIVLVLFLRKF